MTRLLLLAPLALLLAACAPADRLEAPAPGAEVAPDAAAPVPADLGPLPEASLYHLDAAWTSHREDAVAFADLRGRPVLLAMVYANCASACPLIVHDMKRVAEQLPPERAADVQFVLVSLDPTRDTPETMRRFADAHGLDDAWTLLRGDPADVQLLANVLGVRYREEPDGEFAHSNIISALDVHGEIAAQHEGLGTDAPALVAALAAAGPR